MKKPFFVFCILFVLLSTPAFSFIDIWRHPEMAQRNSLFINAKFFDVNFEPAIENMFFISLPQFSVDYMLPLPLPFSAGLFFRTPSPNLNSFGVRLGYHINIRDARTNLYVLYIFDGGFLRNDTLREHGDEEMPVYFYDFRVGIRRMFGSFVCLMLETTFKLRGITIGVSAKLF